MHIVYENRVPLKIPFECKAIVIYKMTAQMRRIRSNETSIDRCLRPEPCLKRAYPYVKRFPRYGCSKSWGQQSMAEDIG